MPILAMIGSVLRQFHSSAPSYSQESQAAQVPERVSSDTLDLVGVQQAVNRGSRVWYKDRHLRKNAAVLHASNRSERVGEKIIDCKSDSKLSGLMTQNVLEVIFSAFRGFIAA